MIASFCHECFEKQRKIDRLEDENKRLKAKLRYRENKSKEGFFGSSTPSAKLPVKPNTFVEKKNKKRGARFGHQGVGRKYFDENEADAVVYLDSEVGGVCPECGELLLNKGMDNRRVVDLPEIKTQKILYHSPHQYCPKSHHSFRPRPTTVLPRNLYGNQLISTAAAMHYLYGIPNVDRYAAYNKVPCLLQYCYTHLLRSLQDIQKQYPQCAEVQDFVNCLAPLLTKAMQLRTFDIPHDLFYHQASQTKEAILLAINSDAQHQAVRSFQDLFRENHHRLYLWADNRNIPADNNRAEPDIRPIVIAHKVSHGSQSERGARTRSILMSVIHSLRKHNSDPTAQLKFALDTLALNPSAKLFPLLFPNPPTLD